MYIFYLCIFELHLAYPSSPYRKFHSRSHRLAFIFLPRARRHLMVFTLRPHRHLVVCRRWFISGRLVLSRLVRTSDPKNGL
ncbi:hypothetical protein HYPSUDRAFT_781687 [Hypholoma sublateritium FD-334 SS-4]|uniref:Uncharacterized protein n=1 Tax=Hypholoma sublateritium (strain FD-334 SS-4) TaxID=945553 RepID=A0A0D2NVS5_HYPSF|nr:hypothetical protein HYPSUDRAFT_781687 [Hypholoma sublateritium FD-334 SS-4]